jgi:hypothetical protein
MAQKRSGEYASDDTGSIPGKGGIIFFVATSQESLRSNKSHIKCTPMAFDRGKGPEPEAAPVSSVEIRNLWSLRPNLLYTYMTWFVGSGKNLHSALAFKKMSISNDE